MQRTSISNDEYDILLMLEKTGESSMKDCFTEEYCVHITNNSKKRIEGEFHISDSGGRKIYPDDTSMIAVKPDGTISVDFSLTTEKKKENFSDRINIEILIYRGIKNDVLLTAFFPI